MSGFGFENKKRKNYFEGWYFKCTDTSTSDNYAIIFAITRNMENPHSFIQFYNGTTNETLYFTFPIETFRYHLNSNTVFIGDNYICEDNVYFQSDELSFEATSTNQKKLRKYQHTHSAMGIMSKAPLECFQEIVFMNAEVKFDIIKKGVASTHSGQSYMERTYGTNFPSKWIWFQSNYSKHNSMVSFSVGLIPFLFFKVKGFFLVLSYNGLEERFGSFNFSKIKIQSIHKTTSSITIKKGKKRVELLLETKIPARLLGPLKNGIMNLEVWECINASGIIKVYHRNILLFEDVYQNAGLELMYD